MPHRSKPQQVGHGIKLALIGASGHFVHVLDETEAMPEVQIVGLAPGVSDESFDAVRAKYRATARAPLYEDYRLLLAEQQPDVVTISTRLDRIAPLAIDAAEAGCHLICEKPLAISHEDLNRLWNAVSACGVECMAMLNNRVHPILAAARQAVADGLIGEVSLLNARKSYRFGNRPVWFRRRETYGGTIPWIGIHALDFIEAAAHSGFASVAAMHANTAHPEWPECEDACTILLQLTGGALATCSVDYLRPGASDSHGDDWLRIVGTRGVIEAHMARNRCTLVTEDVPLHELPPVAADPYYAPLLRQLAAPDRVWPLEATKRSFALTAAALWARDAADRRAVITIPSAPWTGT